MHPHDPSAPVRPFTVLAVCTGNICRSPAVERLLAAELGVDTLATADATSEVVVASAGVGAVVGAPVPPQMASLVERAGASVAGFAARQLTEHLLAAGYRRIALLVGHHSTTGQERQAGYEAALQASGLRPEVHRVAPTRVRISVT